MSTPSSAVPSPEFATLDALLEFLAPAVWRTKPFLCWPADVFAASALALQKSGAYVRILSEWPPASLKCSLDAWTASAKEVADRWRAACTQTTDSVPPEVLKWWETIKAHSRDSVASISSNRAVLDALFQLVAVSDIASVGAGIPGQKEDDQFQLRASKLLQPSRDFGSSLCRNIHPTRIRVLPKMHTPQCGLTIRSISHNLALASSNDIRPYWYTIPTGIELHSFNLLLVPWPESVSPSQFKPLKPQDIPGSQMPRNFRFFRLEHSGDESVVRRHLDPLLDHAKRLLGRIDGVIFPELALTPPQYDRVRDVVLKEDALLVAGVAEPTTAPGLPDYNSVFMDFLMAPGLPISHVQRKHHRWKLDKRQITQYGLGGSLDPAFSWWEYSAVGDRDLNFFALRPWLAMSVLICEDLARQDPVSELLRAVGPNLLIAILMDGPQLASRWPARYATVLADDPGCSVLTLTSLGMAELSRPLHSQAISRVIALWKDARTGEPVQIELPKGASAVALSLTIERDKEWCADGRDDGGAAGFLVLTGIHPISIGPGRT